MDDESSDILGGSTLPIVRGTGSGGRSTSVFSLKWATILAVLVIVYVAATKAWREVQKWQERHYKLATRRRHGIPDNDHRPFNVAYAAVNRARQQATIQKPKPEDLQQPHNDFPGAQQTRQRFNNGQPSATPKWLNSDFYDAASSQQPSTAGASNTRPIGAYEDALDFSNRYNPNAPQRKKEEPQFDLRTRPKASSQTPRSGRRGIFATTLTNDDSRKRALDDQDVSDQEYAKKTRVEGEELIDGDEDAVWQEYTDAQRPKRGSKRVITDDDPSDELISMKKTREKRPRKISKEHTPEMLAVDEDDEPMDNDELTELRSISRGKKRDRAEAGSTFGGDDGDSAREDEGYESSKLGRRRKRRTVSRRKSEAHAHGKKRDREAEDSGSEGEVSGRVKERSSRKKRGKKVVDHSVEEETASDISMSGSDLSKDPLCKGRRIGEEWELNGAQFKVGPNGERLRQALVKKARSRFNMPKDSEHPDRDAHLEVFVETWLTEDEYNAAKDQQLLAWQDSPKPVAAQPPSPKKVPESPTKVGKNLLWSSTSSQKESPAKRGPFRQSLATSSSLRINPFQQSQPAPMRRVSSAYAGTTPTNFDMLSSSSGSAASSPQHTHRTFSKWEKQDLEAEAMRKMRAKVEEQKKAEAAAAEKKSASCASTPVPSSAAPATSGTSFSFPKAADPPASAPATNTFTFPTSASTNASTMPPPPVPAPSVPAATQPTPQTPTSAPVVPKITLTPPAASSSTSSTGQSQIKPPSNPFAPLPTGASGVPASSSTPFSFNAPTNVAASPERNKQPMFSPVATSTPTAANSNIFAAPVRSASEAPAQPSSEQSKPAAPKLSFSFNVPAGNTAPSAPSFSFGPQGGSKPASPAFSIPSAATGGAQMEQEKKPEQASGGNTGGPSLFSRLGGPSQGSQSPSSTPSGLNFSFAKPGGSDTGNGANRGSSVFSNPNAAAAPSKPPLGGSAAGGSSAATAPKFSFGPPSKAAPPAGGSVFSSNTSANFSKPTTPAFAFAAPPKPAAPTATATNNTTNNAPKFSFKPSTGSAFDTSNPGTQSSTAAPTFASTTGNSAFAVGGFSTTPTGTPNPFGGAGSAFSGASGSKPAGGQPSTFAFGNPPAPKAENAEAQKPAFSTTPTGTPNPFGGAGSAFSGASGSKPASGQPSTFAFGNPPAPKTENAEAQKPVFSFGNPSSGSGNNASASPFSIKGAASSNAPTSFSFGTGAGANAASSSSTFGNASQATPNTSAFGFGQGSSAFNPSSNTNQGQNQ